jgi:hypothetical protein
MISNLYVNDEPGLPEKGRPFFEQTGAFLITTVTSAREWLKSPAADGGLCDGVL